MKIITPVMKTTASIFKSWIGPLLLVAGLIFAVACTTTIPAEDDVVTQPSVETATPSPQSNGDTSAPAETPPMVQPTSPVASEPANTPEAETANRRPPPNSGEVPVRRIPNTPVPEPSQLLPSNTLALVMAVKGGSSSGTLKTIVSDSSTGEMLGTKFIQLESSSKSVVLYLPESGDTTVMSSYTSPSWAPHFKRPYTVDDRLYISDKFTSGGAMTITEYATSDLSRGIEWGTQADALDPGYAVAGGQVYFKTASEQQWSMSRGFYNAPGDYISSPFGDRWKSKELEPPELSFRLVSGGDILYGAKLPNEADPITGVFTVDPETGQPADRYLTAFEIEDWDDYHPSSWQDVVIEDGTAYWTGFRNGPETYTVEVLAADLTNPDVFTVYEFDMPATGKDITGFNPAIDADGGYVLIKPFYEGGDRSKVLIYDTAEETAQLFDTGFHITDAQVIFIEDNERITARVN